MKKKLKFIFSLFLISSIFFPKAVLAKEQKGSITIQLTDTENNQSKKDVQFGINQVATIQNGQYVLNQQSSVDLNAIHTSQELESAAITLKKEINHPEYLIKTNENGKALINNLPLGVYLLYAIDVADYERIMPSLIAIPSFDEVEHVMKYDQLIYPKHENFPQLSILKVDAKTQQPLLNQDFEFTIYSDQNCTQALNSIGGNKNNATAVFTIPYGTWYIKETQAPKGYQLSTDIIIVTFNEDGFYLNHQQIETNDKNQYSFSFPNHALPNHSTNTNDPTPLTFYLMICCLSSMTILYLLSSKRVKNRANKKK